MARLLPYLLLTLTPLICFAQGGDFNADGIYDCQDLDSLSTAILGQQHPPQFDLTLDGIVNQSDLTAWLVEGGAAQLPNQAPYLYGDIDLTGWIDNAADWDIWRSNRYQHIGGYCRSDYNVDGRIDVRDFQLMASKMFVSSDPAIGTGLEGPESGSHMRAVYDPTTGQLFADPGDFIMTSLYLRSPAPIDDTTDVTGFRTDVIYEGIVYFDDASQMTSVFLGTPTVDREVMLLGNYPTGLTPEDFGDFEYAGTGSFGDQDHGPFKTAVEFMNVLPGDANLDGAVDVGDFNLWNRYKFDSGDPHVTWGKGDFNRDGVVDVADFNIWNANKFQSSSPLSVPEPSAYGLVMLAVFAMICRRR